MSASKMRALWMVTSRFRSGTPKELDDGDTQALFDAVRAGENQGKKKKLQRCGRFQV